MKKIMLWFTAFLIGTAVFAQKGNHPTDSLVSADKQTAIEQTTIAPALTAEQFLELEKIKANAQASDEEDIAVQIVAISFPFVVAALIVFFVLFFKGKNLRAKYHLMEHALEKGQNLDPKLFQETTPAPKNQLQRAGINIGAGVGILIGGIILMKSNSEFATVVLAISMIPIFIGLGSLAVYFIENRKKENRS